MKPSNQSNPTPEANKADERPVKDNARSTYVTRETILTLLTDNEVSAVASAETADRLADGDEYIDLKQLDRGVQIANHESNAMGRVLPKKSVHQATWEKIIKQLPAHATAKAPVG